MVVGNALPDAGSGGRAATAALSARVVQRAALRGPIRHRLARHAERSPAVGGGLQQTRRWLQAGCLEALVHDLRALLRMAFGRPPKPTAAIIDSRILRSTPENGPRASYDGAKRKRGSKLHIAVDALGHLLALHVTPANHDDRAEMDRLAEAIQIATDQSVELAYADQGYTGDRAATAAKDQGIALEVVKLPEAKRGFVVLPRRWVVERSFAWATRCRRLVKDYERYAATLAGLHVVAFACFMMKQATQLTGGQ